MNRIEQTIAFLEADFEKSPLKEEDKRYRVEHSYRVANIGKEIALAENLNVEAFIIACLLHDYSYIEPFQNDNE